jgi:hypothetical protein
MQYDIIALQCQGTNVALGCTPAGHEWLAGCIDDETWDFLTFIQHIPTKLRIGVLDPTGKLLHFTSGVLH